MAARCPTHRRGPALAVLLAAAALGAAARVQPLPPPAPGVDPAQIERPAPRLAGPDDPALAAELQHLRTLAAGGGTAGRQAAWRLALLHLNGIVPDTRPGEARRWMTQAYTQGETMAAAGLAWCAIEACEGGAADPAAALRWIAALRAVDAPRAQYLEWLLGERLAPPSAAPHAGSDAAARRQEARQQALLARAARGGNAAARIEQGFAQLAEDRPEDAARSFESAAARSPAAAANAQLLRQRLAPLPAPRSRAASAGEQWLAMAQRFHRGEGVPANFAEAIRLYQLAAQAGNVQAQRMLALITSRPAPGGQIDVAWMRELAALDIASAWPRPDVAAPAALPLQRDRTPLFDLLPPRWRQEPPLLR